MDNPTPQPAPVGTEDNAAKPPQPPQPSVATPNKRPRPTVYSGKLVLGSSNGRVPFPRGTIRTETKIVETATEKTTRIGSETKTETKTTRTTETKTTVNTPGPGQPLGYLPGPIGSAPDAPWAEASTADSSYDTYPDFMEVDVPRRPVVLPPFMQMAYTFSFESDPLPPPPSLAPARERLETAISTGQIQTVSLWSPSLQVDESHTKKARARIATEPAGHAELQLPHPFIADKAPERKVAKDADEIRGAFWTPLLPDSLITKDATLVDRRADGGAASVAFAAIIRERLSVLSGAVYHGHSSDAALLSIACENILLTLPRQGSAPISHCPVCNIYSASVGMKVDGPRSKCCPGCGQLIAMLYHYSTVFLAMVQKEVPSDPTVIDCLAIVLNECFRYSHWSSSSRLIMHVRRVFMAAAHVLCKQPMTAAVAAL